MEFNGKRQTVLLWKMYVVDIDVLHKNIGKQVDKSKKKIFIPDWTNSKKPLRLEVFRFLKIAIGVHYFWVLFFTEKLVQTDFPYSIQQIPYSS